MAKPQWAAPARLTVLVRARHSASCGNLEMTTIQVAPPSPRIPNRSGQTYKETASLEGLQLALMPILSSSGLA